MKRTLLLPRAWVRLLATGAIVTGVNQVSPAPAQTWWDFGYQRMQNANSVQPHRKLLVIAVQFGWDSIPNDEWFTNRVFGMSDQAYSVNNFFREASNGRFDFSCEGVTSISLDTAYRSKDGMDEYAYYSRIITKAFTVNNLDWRKYDSDTNGIITEKELALLIIGTDDGACARGSGTIHIPNTTNVWDGTLAKVNCYATLSTCAHELSHTLGAIDLYGSWERDKNAYLNRYLTTMADSSREAYHHDPWHKLQLGWSQPRIASLRSGGVTNIPAAQMGDPTAPLLLFDPQHGTEKFWLLEYRTATCPNGSSYDTNVADNGLVIWQVEQNSDKKEIWLADAQFPTGAENEWYYCINCEGMFFYPGSNGSSGCPGTGGPHTNKYNSYRLPVDNPSPERESGWRKCSQCLMLFYGPNQANSHCRLGTTHDGTGSANYSLFTNAPPPYDSEWRRCTKCETLFHPQKTDNGFCPQTGAHSPGLVAYTPPHRMDYYSVGAEGATTLVYGGNLVWGSDAWTPALRFYDGTPTHTTIHVRPFELGAGSITVEWVTVEDTWVDFAYSGKEYGTFDQPFNTLGEGVQGVPYGGAQLNTLKIKKGARTENAHITKPMRIQAYGGPVTVVGH